MQPIPEFGPFLKELEKFETELVNPRSGLKEEEIVKFLQDNQALLNDPNRKHLLTAQLKSLSERMKMIRDPGLVAATTFIDKTAEATSVLSIPASILSMIFKFSASARAWSPVLGRVALLSKMWHQWSERERIHYINENQYPLYYRFTNAEAALNFISHLTAKDEIKYLNLNHLQINNAQFESFLKNCINLTHLSVSYTQISGDALKFLRNVPNLVFLDISGCTKLERDALKHVRQLPKLATLNIKSCTELELDAIKHLRNLPALTSLNVENCRRQVLIDAHALNPKFSFPEGHPSFKPNYGEPLTNLWGPGI